MPTKLTQEQFINKAKYKHNNYYDYSLVNYKTGKDKVISRKLSTVILRLTYCENGLSSEATT